LGWRWSHLQSIRSRLVPRTWSLDDVSTAQDLLLDMHDGSGDRLAAWVHTPSDPVPGRPLVLLVHGLGGSAESAYVRATARGLLRLGFPVARVDLRGAGRSGEHSRGLYHAGRTDDLRDVLRQIAPAAQDGLALMGFSLGGNATLKLAGEPLDGIDLRRAVAVSPPLDLVAGSSHLKGMMFGRYEYFILNGVREDLARPGPTAGLSDEEREVVASVRSLREFDDVITARRNGWTDAMEYYEVNSSIAFLPTIAVPTLIIHALDDPLIPAEPYRSVDWAAIEARGFVRRAITRHGGHVGFHRRGHVYPWYVPRAARFLLEQPDLRPGPPPGPARSMAR
jgi:predicted alpha/beta-fold hydrolase